MSTVFVAMVATSHFDFLAIGASRPEAIGALLDAWLEHARFEQQERSALLVFDNAADPDEISSLLPRRGRTNVLVTTNLRVFEALGTQIEVGVFAPAEAVEFLITRTGRRDPHGAAQVAEALGFLPLALAQAAWVIRSQQLTYAAYLARLDALSIEDLLRQVPGDRYPRGTGQAIVLSLAEVERHDDTGLTTPVCDLLAMSSSTGMRRNLLQELVGRGGSAGDVDVDRTVGALVTSSLASFSLDGEVVLVHRLVQRVLRDRARREGRFISALETMITGLTDRTIDDKRQIRRVGDSSDLIDHINTIWDLATEDKTILAAFEQTGALRRLIQLRIWSAIRIAGFGDLTRAIGLGRAAVSVAGRVFGWDSQGTMTARQWMSSVYQAGGDVRATVEALELLVADLSRTFGPDHVDTLAVRNGLGYWLEVAGDLDRATEVFQQNLAVCERDLPEDHYLSLITPLNLANVHRSADRFDVALRLIEQNLAQYRRIRGDDHPETLNAQGELARSYRSVDRYDEAIALHEHNLDRVRTIMGRDHPNVLWWQRHLANAYADAGRIQDAIDLLKRTVEEYVAMYGEQSLEPVEAQLALARVYLTAAQPRNALGNIEEALTVLTRRAGGNDNPQTLKARALLAAAYAATGRRRRAKSLYRQAMADYERTFGRDHLYTNKIRDRLAPRVTTRSMTAR